MGFFSSVYGVCIVLLAGFGLFLSVWIIFTPANFSLYPLAVGAPEISPWLIALNALALGLLGLRGNLGKAGWVAIACALVGLLLSCWPLIQFPGANQQMERAMQQAFGNDALTVPAHLAAKFRPQPFVLRDAFTGLRSPETRYTPDILFAKPDGVSLMLDVYRPGVGATQPSPRSYPTVVMIHGGAWRTGSPKDNAAFNQHLAAQGYTVVAISYRLAPQYHFPAQLQDVQTALRFIQAHAAEYEIDLNKLAIMGRSAGGHLAKLAAYQPTAPTFKAVISYYGPIDLTAGYYDLPNPDPIDAPTTLRSFLGGSPKELPDLYKQASPIEFLRPSLPPTLLVYGGRDHVMQAKFGRSLSERLLTLNNQAVFLEIPWAEHAFDAVFHGVSNQLALYYTERFLYKTLKSGVAE
jgi:acetyl esterase/lipase